MSYIYVEFHAVICNTMYDVFNRYIPYYIPNLYLEKDFGNYHLKLASLHANNDRDNKKDLRDCCRCPLWLHAIFWYMLM